MEPTIFLAVLAAAAMHAGWNAFVKGGGDPFAVLAQMSCVAGIMAVCILPFFPLPAAPVWPWLCATWVLHTAYRAFLSLTYKSGDLSQGYPIARGTAPLLTAIGSAVLLGERLHVAGYLGILTLISGVLLLSLRGGRGTKFEARTVGFALLTASSIAGYTIIDGQGSRINGSAVSFILWETFGNALVMTASTLVLRGVAVYRDPPQPWPRAMLASLVSTVAYMIAAWAMTRAPIALVAALRETSVLFAAIIAVVWLKEPLTGWRVAAAALVVLGVVLLRLA